MGVIITVFVRRRHDGSIVRGAQTTRNCQTPAGVYVSACAQKIRYIINNNNNTVHGVTLAVYIYTYIYYICTCTNIRNILKYVTDLPSPLLAPRYYFGLSFPRPPARTHADGRFFTIARSHARPARGNVRAAGDESSANARAPPASARLPSTSRFPASRRRRRRRKLCMLNTVRRASPSIFRGTTGRRRLPSKNPEPVIRSASLPTSWVYLSLSLSLKKSFPRRHNNSTCHKDARRRRYRHYRHSIALTPPPQ